MSEYKLIGNYVALPDSTSKSEQWKSFTASTRIVYITMLQKYRHSGPDANGRVKWRQDELAKVTGFTRRTVITCIAELIEQEWISVWEPGGRWIDGTTYEVEPEWANGRR